MGWRQSLFLVVAWLGCCSAELHGSILANTTGGPIRGKWSLSSKSRTFAAFEGIPFAEPPVGELRFKAPVPPARWTEVRDAGQPGSICPQTDMGRAPVSGSEDCLYLNVYAPETLTRCTPLPVMVFIHGGAFMAGTGSVYGPEYLMNRDVVFVNLNYRLGPLGERREEVVDVDVEGFFKMCDTSFQEHFRMSKALFERLVDAIYSHLLQKGKIKRNRTPFNHCVMMGIWPLFNQDTFRSTGLHFRQKKMGIHYHYQYIIEALRNMAPDYIKWPNEYEREIIKADFEEKYGYVGVVGCMDGVNINITAPLEQPQRYVNRHHSYSILVQAVCDHRLIYRDIYTGEAGCIGDARNFDRSPLSKNLLLCPDLLSDGEHIIADGAYTLTDKVLVPYTNDGNLSRRQRTHNYLLSASRSRVENSFALLRCKNRRLKQLPMRNPELVQDHIMASFVLHNFIKLDGHNAQGLPPTIPRLVPEEEFERILEESKELGAIKREYIAQLLHPHE